MTLLHQAAQKAVEAPALKQVLDALRLGRVACEWADHHDEAATFGAAMEAARSLAALQQQPEPVAHEPQRMTESEIHAHSWWCPHCRKDVPPEMVTKDGEHYLESGGCGYAVRAEPALQHQEVPREPVADFDTWQQNPYTKVLMDSIKNDYMPRLDAEMLIRAAASPSTTRQQEVGNEQQAYELGAKGAPASEHERLLFEAWMRGHCWALCATWNGKQYVSDAEQGGDLDPRAMATRRLFAAWRDRAALAAAPSTPEKAGGVPASIAQCDKCPDPARCAGDACVRGFVAHADGVGEVPRG